jgi:hypothetical protein
VGDWVVGWHVLGCDYKTKAWKVIEIKGDQAVPRKEWATTFEHLRPARPDEIPQEEVEYWEYIKKENGHSYGIYGRVYKKIEKDVFVCNLRCDEYTAGTELFISNKEYLKPSTREAYEAQEKYHDKDYEYVECIVNESCTNRVFKVGGRYVPSEKGAEWFVYEGKQYSFKGDKLAFKRVSVDYKLTNVSQLNKNENEYSKKTIEVCGSNFSIGRSDQIRGKGIDYSEVEVTIGGRYSTNKGRSIEC